jgi:hypothetical protein
MEKYRSSSKNEKKIKYPGKIATKNGNTLFNKYLIYFNE